MSCGTTVTHVNDPAGYDVYIGRAVPRRGFRASIWGNPYRDGDSVGDFEQFLRRTPYLLERLPELRGKRLACWCKKQGWEDCHGDVIVQVLHEFFGEVPHNRP